MDCIIIQTNELSFGKCSPLEKQSSVCDRDRPRNSINMFNQTRHGAPVMKVGGLAVQGQIQLCSEFQASLGHLRPCHKQRNTFWEKELPVLQQWKKNSLGYSEGAAWIQTGT